MTTTHLPTEAVAQQMKSSTTPLQIAETLIHTFDNRTHRAGAPNSSVAPIMGGPPRSRWPHDVVVWIRSSPREYRDIGSLRRLRRGRGGADPKTIGVSSLRHQTQLSVMSSGHHGVDGYGCYLVFYLFYIGTNRHIQPIVMAPNVDN